MIKTQGRVSSLIIVFITSIIYLLHSASNTTNTFPPEIYKKLYYDELHYDFPDHETKKNSLYHIHARRASNSYLTLSLPLNIYLATFNYYSKNNLKIPHTLSKDWNPEHFFHDLSV